jgi:hypothetical protein
MELFNTALNDHEPPVLNEPPALLWPLSRMPGGNIQLRLMDYQQNRYDKNTNINKTINKISR